MVENKLFSQGILMTLILFFALTFFFNVLPAAVPREQAQELKRTIIIKAGPDYDELNYYFLFEDPASDREITHVYFQGMPRYLQLFPRQTRMKVYRHHNLMLYTQTFTAAEIEDMKELLVGKGGQIAVVRVPSVFSQYLETVKRGDVESLHAMLPDVKKAGEIDRSDDKGITALGHAIINFRNALDMMNELMAKGASLFQKDRSGKSQIDLAGAQKGNLLKVLAVKSECPVCLEEKQLEALLCGHQICRSCLIGILKKTGLCPSCRVPIQ